MCHCDASDEVLAQSDFGRCRLKNFKMAPPSWISEWNNFSSSESLCHCNASHQIFAQSHLGVGRRCHLKNFKVVAVAAIFDIRMERF